MSLACTSGPCRVLPAPGKPTGRRWSSRAAIAALMWVWSFAVSHSKAACDVRVGVGVLDRSVRAEQPPPASWQRWSNCSTRFDTCRRPSLRGAGVGRTWPAVRSGVRRYSPMRPFCCWRSSGWMDGARPVASHAFGSCLVAAVTVADCTRRITRSVVERFDDARSHVARAAAASGASHRVAVRAAHRASVAPGGSAAAAAGESWA